MSGGYPGDEPPRGGVRGGYGQEPPYRAADPRERDQPDEDTPRAGGGSGDLSDLWREPDPWAADARRGLDARQGPGSWPENGLPGREDPYRRDEDPCPRDEEDAQRTRAYAGDRERRDGQRYDEPGYRGGSTGRGAPRPGAGSRRDAPGPAQGYQSPVVWNGPDQGRSRDRFRGGVSRTRRPGRTGTLTAGTPRTTGPAIRHRPAGPETSHGRPARTHGGRRRHRRDRRAGRRLRRPRRRRWAPWGRFPRPPAPPSRTAASRPGGMTLSGHLRRPARPGPARKPRHLRHRLPGHRTARPAPRPPGAHRPRVTVFRPAS